MTRTAMLKFTICLLTLLALPISPVHASTFTDNFDTGINSFYWSIDLENTSNTVIWDSGRVVMTQAAGPNSNSGSNLLFNFPISGDFEARVDFALINWPSTNQERLGIRTTWGAVERISDQYPFDGKSGELFVTDVNMNIKTLNTTATTGILKFTRNGNLSQGWYSLNNGSTWELIGGFNYDGATSGIIQLSIWPNTPTAGVQIAFDNFYLNTQSDIPAVPIPAAVWLLGSGLIGLIGLRRFRK